MKGIETRFSEATAAAKRAGMDITPYIGGGSLEQRLNNLSEALKAKGVKVTEARPVRNNGRGTVEILESDALHARIKAHAKKLKCSLREAAIYQTGTDLYKFGEPGSESFMLAEAWKNYCRFLRDEEIQSLIARKVPVPTN